MDAFRVHPSVREILPSVEEQVKKGAVTPGSAADNLIKEFMKWWTGYILLFN